MKCKIEIQLKDELENSDFDFGYYKGRHSTKRWILDDKDLELMYSKYKTGEIHLWCDILKIDENEPPLKEEKRGMHQHKAPG